jgi:hypothetical protein
MVGWDVRDQYSGIFFGPGVALEHVRTFTTTSRTHQPACRISGGCVGRAYAGQDQHHLSATADQQSRLADRPQGKLGRFNGKYNAMRWPLRLVTFPFPTNCLTTITTISNNRTRSPHSLIHQESLMELPFKKLRT